MTGAGDVRGEERSIRLRLVERLRPLQLAVVAAAVLALLILGGLAAGYGPTIAIPALDRPPSVAEPPPGVIAWGDAPPLAQVGSWEAAWIRGAWRARPVPGTEGPLRVLAVSDAFRGGRRIEVDMVYRGHIGPTDYAFGILPLWSGDPPEGGQGNFAAAWYRSGLGAVGLEFHRGGAAPAWVSSYRNLELEARVRYRVTVEVRGERDAAGNHLRYRGRVRWEREGGAASAWIELADDEGGAPLAEGAYAVALVSDWSEVDFGTVSVTRLP